MNTLINVAITRYKITLCLFLLVSLIGLNQYNSIAKEAEPDISIPFVQVSVSLEGISPQDGISQLLKPLEQEIKQIDGVKSYEGNSFEGLATLGIEFDTGIDLDVAYSDVKDAVDKAKPELPDEVNEPVVKEVSMATINPMITVMVSGTSPESTRLTLARKLQDDIKSLPEVLEVELIGDREESLEVIVSPDALYGYKIDAAQVSSFVSNNNILVPAGTIDEDNSKITFQVPGSVRNANEILNLPVMNTLDGVVKLSDIADIKLTYKDKTNEARLNGEPTLALKVMKKPGENLIQATDNVKELVLKYQEIIPDNTKLVLTDDGSEKIRTMLSDLENNVVASVVLVVVFIMMLLGYRSSILVGIAIPGSFLIVFTIMGALGFTVNMMVLFGLIMSVGMLVDGAIVVVEYATKLQEQGVKSRDAFIKASQRMAWPIVSSTATTLVAFMPLLFWPGTTGEFMMYLPMTLIIALISSLIMALLIIPMIGALIAKKQLNNTDKVSAFSKIEGIYSSVVNQAIQHKFLTILAISLISVGIVKGSINASNGVIFFPETEAEGMVISAKLAGNISLKEKSEYIKEIEKIILPFKEIETVFSTIGGSGEDVGNIRLSLIDWDKRKPSSELIPEIRERLDTIKGLNIEIIADKGGPGGGKDLVLELKGVNIESLYAASDSIIEKLNHLDYLMDIEDSRPKSGLQWDILVNREKAAIYDASVLSVGSTIKMITSGIKLSQFQPDGSDEPSDIVARFPKEHRNLNSLRDMQVKTSHGMVPIDYLVDFEQVQKVASIKRSNGKIMVKLEANLVDGVILSKKMPELKSIIEEVVKSYPGIEPKFGGDQEKQQESMQFLISAFGIALSLMFIILLAQFNYVSQAFIVLSAVVLSTVGVMGLLMVLGQPFGVIMGGIGVISLAGIVVNNNIVLIDSFNEKVKLGLNKVDAARETGIDRLRPVLLTTITTGIGLVPMAIAMNLDFATGQILWDAPSSKFWTQLSQTVVGGLIFSTLITLILTPCLLSISKPKPISQWFKSKS